MPFFFLICTFGLNGAHLVGRLRVWFSYVFMDRQIPISGVTMKFAEVTILLREIADQCPKLDGFTITLVPQKAMFPLYRGYHINIKGNPSNESIGCLRKIVEGHDLAMKIKSDSVLVYDPR
jgi:hypothetical protein